MSTTIHGVETTLDFGRFVLDHEAFVSGNFDTGFVGTHFDASRFGAYLNQRKEGQNWAAASAALKVENSTGQIATSSSGTSEGSRWKRRHLD